MWCEVAQMLCRLSIAADAIGKCTMLIFCLSALASIGQILCTLPFGINKQTAAAAAAAVEPVTWMMHRAAKHCSDLLSWILFWNLYGLLKFQKKPNLSLCRRKYLHCIKWCSHKNYLNILNSWNNLIQNIVYMLLSVLPGEVGTLLIYTSNLLKSNG